MTQEESQQSYYVPIKLLGFAADSGEASQDNAKQIAERLQEIVSTKEYKEKIYELSMFISEQFGINFLLVPDGILPTDNQDELDVINQFVNFLENAVEEQETQNMNTE